MSTNTFLKLGDIEGESTISGFEKQMELINIVSGRFMQRPVDRHTVPHLILHDQHPKLFKLFSQILNIKTDNPVIQFHVGTVVEHLYRFPMLSQSSVPEPLSVPAGIGTNLPIQAYSPAQGFQNISGIQSASIGQ